jgi:hypothetical protein
MSQDGNNIWEGKEQSLDTYPIYYYWTFSYSTSTNKCNPGIGPHFLNLCQLEIIQDEGKTHFRHKTPSRIYHKQSYIAIYFSTNTNMHDDIKAKDQNLQCMQIMKSNKCSSLNDLNCIF